MGPRRRSPMYALGLLGILAATLQSPLGGVLVVGPGGDYETIQDAIDAAGAGDEVLVGCGTYFENVVLKDGVHLRGEDPRCAIVDGGYAGDVVRVPPVDQPTTVEGLTLRNGELRPGGSFGAGVFVQGPGAPTITRNVIEGNGTQGTGVGIYVQGTFSPDDSPVITRNVIRGNSSCCWGGGVSLRGTPGARVTGNLIAGNSAYYGGGIYVYGSATIANNTILGNAAWIGGGIAAFGDVPVSNNLVQGNTAVIYGGGIWTSGNGAASHNDVVDNSPEDWDTPSGDPTGTSGNVSLAPALIDGDRLTFEGVQPRSTSPLVDAGTAVAGVTSDLRGVPRPLDGDADGIPRLDIGARENEGVTGVRFEEGERLYWDTSGQTFDLYRGVLATLRATGIYTQDPDDVPGADVLCAVAQPGWVQSEDPLPGGAFFYLVAVRGTEFEGPLGFTSDGTPRPQTLLHCLN